MKFKVGDRVKFFSFGKPQTGTIVAIRDVKEERAYPLLVEVDKKFSPSRRVQKYFHTVTKIK